MIGCHVLAHESFEDEVTAKIMNDHFVNIKVRYDNLLNEPSLYFKYRWIERNDPTLTGFT